MTNLNYRSQFGDICRIVLAINGPPATISYRPQLGCQHQFYSLGYLTFVFVSVCRRIALGNLVRYGFLVSAVWLGLSALASPAAVAQGKAALARETAEFILRKFGKPAADEGLETLTQKVTQLVSRYGDEAAEAARKVGPRAFQLVDEAGEQGALSVQLLAKYGDQGVWIASQPQRLALYGQLGDDAAQAMIKHGEVAEPLLKSFGWNSAQALKQVSPQNGRRLAMMAQDGEFAQLSQSPELLKVVGKYGDAAMEFIWRNKGTLAVGAALTAFLADPEPFIHGDRDLSEIAAEKIALPVANQLASRTNWTLVIITGIILVVVARTLRQWRHPRPTATTRS